MFVLGPAEVAGRHLEDVPGGVVALTRVGAALAARDRRARRPRRRGRAPPWPRHDERAVGHVADEHRDVEAQRAFARASEHDRRCRPARHLASAAGRAAPAGTRGRRSRGRAGGACRDRSVRMPIASTAGRPPSARWCTEYMPAVVRTSADPAAQVDVRPRPVRRGTRAASTSTTPPRHPQPGRSASRSAGLNGEMPVCRSKSHRCSGQIALPSATVPSPICPPRCGTEVADRRTPRRRRASARPRRRSRWASRPRPDGISSSPQIATHRWDAAA